MEHGARTLRHAKVCKSLGVPFHTGNTILLMVLFVLFLFPFNSLFAAVDCGRLSVPLNGSSYGDFTVFPESIRFSCDTGFIMSGSRVRKCQANGTWSGIDTICNGEDLHYLEVIANSLFYI